MIYSGMKNMVAKIGSSVEPVSNSANARNMHDYVSSEAGQMTTTCYFNIPLAIMNKDLHRVNNGLACGRHKYV